MRKSKYTDSHNMLYFTGEESLQQLAMRAKRLGLTGDKVQVLMETEVEIIAQLVLNEKSRYGCFLYPI